MFHAPTNGSDVAEYCFDVGHILRFKYSKQMYELMTFIKNYDFDLT